MVEIDAVAEIGAVIGFGAAAEIGAVIGFGTVAEIGAMIGAGVRVRIDETKMVDALTMPRF